MCKVLVECALCEGCHPVLRSLVVFSGLLGFVMRFASVVAVVSFALMASACQTITGPSFMPSGFAHHREYFKSAPGPQSPPIGYEYTPVRNEESLAIWKIVAADLIDQLQEKYAGEPGPVYLEYLPYSNVFNNSFDNALREELLGRGYTLTDTPEGAMFLAYEAFKADDDEMPKKGLVYHDQDYEMVENKGEPSKLAPFIMRLIILEKDDRYTNPFQSGVIEGVYEMPAYGYKGGEGHHFRSKTSPLSKPSRQEKGPGVK